MGELERACRRLIEAFDHLGIRYLVGGSAASSVHGWFRSTADIDSEWAARLDVADLLERAFSESP